jgi:uncharacterized protein YdeI (YjbR/CyaY-like superfamily)
MAAFFPTADEFAKWLEANGDFKTELVVGYYKKGSGRASMSWAESVDEALCFGWIDGVRKRIDEHSYQIRFTPRKAQSIWSATNLQRVSVLERAGRMRQAGLQAFARRREDKTGIYSYEQREAANLEAGDEAVFRKAKAAWKFFAAQPPGYRRLVIWRIVSAKRAETRVRRLTELIQACRERRRL